MTVTIHYSSEDTTSQAAGRVGIRKLVDDFFDSEIFPLYEVI